MLQTLSLSFCAALRENGGFFHVLDSALSPAVGAPPHAVGAPPLLLLLRGVQAAPCYMAGDPPLGPHMMGTAVHFTHTEQTSYLELSKHAYKLLALGPHMMGTVVHFTHIEQTSYLEHAYKLLAMQSALKCLVLLLISLFSLL